MTKPRRLRELLKADGILVSPGVYDGYSVRLVEKMGFRTACTTGAGVANSRLGVPDVGIMGLEDNLAACRVLARSVDIPVMADADSISINDIDWVEIRSEPSIRHRLLFNPGHGLEERLTREQFV